MAPYFNFERLDVYRASLALLGEIRKLAASIPRGNADLHDQLRRAATSINLNIAEGSGERSTKEKARFYRMALRSAHEAAAALYSLVWLAGLPATEIEPALKLLHRIAAMLTRMAGVGREQTG